MAVSLSNKGMAVWNVVVYIALLAFVCCDCQGDIGVCHN